MGVIGGGVFQAIKGFRNAPVVSPDLLWVDVGSAVLPTRDAALKTAWSCQSCALIHSGAHSPTPSAGSSVPCSLLRLLFYVTSRGFSYTLWEKQGGVDPINVGSQVCAGYGWFPSRVKQQEALIAQVIQEGLSVAAMASDV
ncbi:hypothetical protein H8959_000861 [Pygathrix nigripes]